LAGILGICINKELVEGETNMKLWSNSNISTSIGGFNPERRLLAAILQRAITDFLSGEGDLQLSAKEWLYGEDDPNETFGFTYICEALDFHQEELRKAIAGQHAKIVRDKKEANAQKALAAAAVATQSPVAQSSVVRTAA